MRYARLYPSDFAYCVVGPDGIDARSWGGQYCRCLKADGSEQWFEFTESEIKCASVRVVYEWKPVPKPARLER